MKYTTKPRVVLVVLGFVLSCRAESGELKELHRKAAIRRPVALVAMPDRHLLVASGRSGTLSRISRSTHKVQTESRIADSLSDAVGIPRQNGVFVLDNSNHCLLACRWRENQFETERMTDLPRYPVGLVAAENSHQLCVASLWSQALTIVEFDRSWSTMQGTAQIPLPFAPRELMLLDADQKLLVADAFGGMLAVIDLPSRSLRAVRKIPGHNIRGLAFDEQRSKILISHQKLNPLARADFDDVHWGSLITNAVRFVDRDTFLQQDDAPLKGGWLERQGRVGNATADPGPVVIDGKGRQAVALSGVGEVAVSRSAFASRFVVGRQPSALLSVDDQLFVANRFSDSVSVIDLVKGTSITTIPLGPAPDLTAVDRGELLFYDAKISHDGWMSCHSCHTDGHTNGLLADTLGDGDYGAPKRIPSLLGTKTTGPWAWNGSVRSLDDQIRKSAKTTMHGADLSDDQTDDLVAYLQSLQRPTVNRRLDMALVARGRAVFIEQKCGRCHRPPSYTIDGTFDVGLVDEQNRRRFNPPSLRGVGRRPRLFHDGRATGLRAVIEDAKHQLNEPLPPRDVDALIEFLRSL